jgi:dTDP-4-amino-4,6-dideoxygalactose transaminase
MKVPFLDLKAQYHSVKNELHEAVNRVLESQKYVLGPDVQALEAELADLCGVRHGVGVSNGSDALLAALMALDLKPDDEVIVPPFTFFATAASVLRAGAKPVFADILPDTFNIDPQAVEKAVSPKTKAILPVHLYGQSADMDPILKIAAEHNLAVIEDAAQAIGAQYKDRPTCSMGTTGTLSFYPTKNLSAVGEAGMVLTDDDKMAETLRIIRLQGQVSSYEHARLGANLRMDGIQAAALRVKFKRLQEWNTRRQENAARYDEALADTAIQTPVVRDDCHHVYHQYTVRTPKRDELKNFLQDSEIASSVFYPIPLHLQPCFEYLGYKKGDLPEAEKASQEVLSLPIFPEMTTEQQNYVIETLRNFK